MPTPALLLLLATLLPLASFAGLVFLGRRMGTPLAGYVATAAISASFALSVIALMAWLSRGDTSAWGADRAPVNLTMRWIPVGTGVDQDHPGFLDLGIYVDSLTVLMFNMVTLVATLVHVFSLGYMRADPRYPRYFTYLGLFCFSMLGLVIGGTLLQIFIFWELVGLCSYLLIGFWYENRSASNAALKAFLTNRVGDFGFLIGFGILFYHVGNATLPHLWVTLGDAGGGGAISLPGAGVFSPALLTATGVCLFFGAVGKSAQFPLHVWLPDAMEGPTPVSALIHAATMVAAGVYLVGRIFPILTPDAKLFIAIIGCITLTMAALIAMAQSDIKRVLAYSTVSQLGYMIMAMGVGSWVGGLFHLITHAFFKALLFLAAGSVINAAGHEQEMPHFGGLLRKIPVTAITFGVAVLAIAGTGIGGIGLSGYYSKDIILSHAGAFASLAAANGHSPYYWAFFVLPAATAYLTAFYMMRCWMLTFWGKPRNPEVYENAREAPLMWGPLVVLAVLSVFAGSVLPVRSFLQSSIRESNNLCTSLKPGFNGFATAWPTDESTVTPHAGTRAEDVRDVGDPARRAESGGAAAAFLEHGERLVRVYAAWAFLVGIGAAFLVYLNGYALVSRVLRFKPAVWVYVWLYRRMYFDELYFALFVGVTAGAARFAGWLDRNVVDGLVNFVGWAVRQTSVIVGLNDRFVFDGAVNGAARLTRDLGAASRAPQTGRLRLYVTMLMICIALGLAATIVVVLTR